MYGLSLTVLISSIICMNASLKAKDIGATNANGLSDGLHPFADREITRQRPDVDSRVNNGEETPREMPCSCMKTSTNTRRDQRKVITGSGSCRCGIDWSNRVYDAGKGLHGFGGKLGTFNEFQPRISCKNCSKAYESNSSFVDADDDNNSNSSDDDENRSSHINSLSWKRKARVEYESVQLIGQLYDSYKTRVAIRTSKGCVASGRALSVPKKAIYVSTIVEDMNNTTTNKGHVHEILHPIKQLPMLSRGVFVNRGLHTMITGLK